MLSAVRSALALAFVAVFQLPKEVTIPMHEQPQEILAKQVAKHLDAFGIEDRMVMSLSPLIPYAADLDAFNTEEHQSVYRFNQDNPEEFLENGDIFVWDAHYCPNEGNLPIAYFSGHSDFRFLVRVDPDVPFPVLNGGSMHYQLFEYHGKPLDDGELLEKAMRNDTAGTFYFNGLSESNRTELRFENSEFVFGMNGLERQKGWPEQLEMRVSGIFNPDNPEGEAHLVMETIAGDSVINYQAEYIIAGRFSRIMKPWTSKKDSTFKMYIWNPQKEAISFENLDVEFYP